MNAFVRLMAGVGLWIAAVECGSAQDLAAVTRPGANIQRSMHLLQSSTPDKRNTVRVLFYGQSITAQNWWKIVAEELRKRFPHAHLVIENRAIGGFTAPALIHTAEYDLYPFYPDLLIFHVYGGSPGGMTQYEEILRRVRSRTTAEILLATHHDVGRESDYQQSERIRELAVKHQCGLVDIERHWKETLAREGLTPKAFLQDGVHMNAKGCELYARLITAFLQVDPAPLSAASRGLATEIPLPAGSGPWEVRFTGNRIDAIAAPDAGGAAVADALVDGRKPSSFPQAYSFTRPSTAPFSWVPAIKILAAEKPLAVEDWALGVTESTPDGKQLRFRLTGSVTGDDGEGANAERFVSKSGRVVIEPGSNWMIAWSLGYRKKQMPADFKVTWRVEPHFADVLQFSAQAAAGVERAVTLLQGLDLGEHTLRLTPRPGAAVKLRALRAYRPPLAASEKP